MIVKPSKTRFQNKIHSNCLNCLDCEFVYATCLQQPEIQFNSYFVCSDVTLTWIIDNKIKI